MIRFYRRFRHALKAKAESTAKHHGDLPGIGSNGAGLP
jgi:hypothetical protein